MTRPDPDGAGSLVAPVVMYQYDSAGNVVSITDASGGVMTYGYDDLGRKITETGPDPDGEDPLAAPIIHYAYDKANNPISVSDALGHTTAYAYDARNRRIAILDAEGGLTEFFYDDVGNLVALTDPVGNTTSWVYDNLNRIVSETNELGYTRYFTYDLAGRQIEKIDRNGRVTQYGYDLADHLTSEIWYSSTADAAAHQDATNEIRWQYDSVGRLISESDNYSSSAYTYDSLGRHVTETISNLNSEIVVLAAGYTRADAFRTSLSVTIGGVADLQQTFEYTSTGLLTHIAQNAQAGGNAVAAIGIDLAYDSLGRLVQLDRYQGNSFVASSTWQYDSQNRLVALTHAQGQNVLAGYTWTYDTARRLTDATSPDGPVHYSYDDTDQLTGADYEESGLPDEEYQWDANGNRSNPGWVTGPNNQLLSDGTFWYSYDPEGNRTARFVWTDTDADSVIDDGERSQITEYSWDNRNRLTRVAERAVENGPLTKAIDYLYDTQNRWIGHIADLDGAGPEMPDVLHFVYDDKQILFQQDASGSITRRYLWNPTAVDQLLAQDEGSATTDAGEVQWTLTDHLGSVRDLAVNENGCAIVEYHLQYTSFGELIWNRSSRDCVLIGFVGRAFDTASSLSLSNSRFFEPETGRWLSQDWIGFLGDDPNTYSYVGNVPTQLVDPTGCWGERVHRDMTDMLAQLAGFSRNNLGLLANDPDTDDRSPIPVWLNAVGAQIVTLNGTVLRDFAQTMKERTQRLSFWHFPRSANEMVVPGSPEAWLITQIGISGQRNGLTAEQAMWFFGEGLHTLQDSYSHQGRPVSNGLGHSRGFGTALVWIPGPTPTGRTLTRLYDLDDPLSGARAALSESADDTRLYRADAIAAGRATWKALKDFRTAYPEFFAGAIATDNEAFQALETFFPSVPIAFRSQPSAGRGTLPHRDTMRSY